MAHGLEGRKCQCTGAEALRELNTRGLARWHKSIYQLTQRARGVFTGGLRVVVRGTDLQSPSGMGTREKMAENGKGKAAVGVVSRLSAS